MVNRQASRALVALFVSLTWPAACFGAAAQAGWYVRREP